MWWHEGGFAATGEGRGQAGSSSRIENYLGFPSGISGQELTARAYTQAQKFGAEAAQNFFVSGEVAAFVAGVKRGLADHLAAG